MKKTLLLLTILFINMAASTSVDAQPLSGTVNLPKLSPPTLLTLSAVISHLNNYGVSGPLVINCSANETAPGGGYVLGSSTLNATLSATNSITINGNFKTLTAFTGTGSNDAIFSIQGADFVTVKNLKLRESATNTTNTTKMEKGFSINKLATEDGSKTVSITNCNISLDNTNTSTATGVSANGATGIYIGNCTANSTTALTVPSSSDGANEGIYIAYDTITNVTNGIYEYGTGVVIDGVVINDKNTTIQNNIIENFTHYGIYMVFSNNDNISQNRLNNLNSGGTAPTSNSIYGMFYNGATIGTNNSWVCEKNKIDLTIAGTGNSCIGVHSQIVGTGTTEFLFDTIKLTASGTSAILIGVNGMNVYGVTRIVGNYIYDFTTPSTNDRNLAAIWSGQTSSLAPRTGYPTISYIDSNVIANFNIAGAANVFGCVDQNIGGAAPSYFMKNTIKNFKVSSATSKVTMYQYRNTITSPSSHLNATENYFQNIDASATSVPLTMFDVPANTVITYDLSKNKVENVTGGTNTLTAVLVDYGKSLLAEKDTFRNFKAAGDVAMYKCGYSGVGMQTITISNNYFDSIGTTGTSNTVDVIKATSGNSNQTTDFTFKESAINNVYATGTASIASAIKLEGGFTTFNISNNVIANVLSPNNTAAYSSSYGFNLTNSGTNNIYFNSVKMNTASTAGSGYGATGLLFNVGATNKIQNNILHVNVLADTALNNVAAIRGNSGAAKTAVSKANFDASANIYYSPTGNKNFLYVDGTTNNSLVNGYHVSGLIEDSLKNIVNDTFFNSPCGSSSYHKFMAKGAVDREVNTFTEDNLSGSPLTPTGVSYAEAHATDGPISVDFRGDPRPFGSSDIGAVEFAGTLPPQLIITITSSTGFDTACTYNLPTLIGNIPSYFTKVSYQWYRDTTKLIGRTMRTLMVSPISGVYILKVYDSLTGCEYASAPFPLTIVPPPPAKISYYDSLVFCASSAIVLQANKGHNYVYQWSRDGVDLAGEDKDHLVADKSGDYRVRINTPLGCPTTSAFVRIKVYPLPTPTIIYGGPGKLSTQKYFTYQWYKNNIKIDSFAKARDYYTLFTGDGAYSVEVTDSNGCTAKSDVYLYASGISTQSAQAANIRIYPNPTQDYLNIESPITLQLSLSDISGRVVLKAQNTNQLNLEKLQAGMYLLSITDIDGKLIKVEKVTKVK